MTVIELIVGLLILALVGILFTQLLLHQGRFFDKQAQENSARSVSRSALNRVISDLRMVEASGGVIAASATSVTVRVPYAIGVACAPLNGMTTIALLPVDSARFAASGFYGYAWRDDSSGAYTYVESGTSKTSASASDCTNAGLDTIPGGKVVAVSPGLPAQAVSGTPVFLFRRIRYDFKASSLIPGKIGLWRTVIHRDGSETADELVAPFASTASFKFFALNDPVAEASPPASLSSLRGFELHFDGMSERAAGGQASAESAPFITAVYFKNRMT